MNLNGYSAQFSDQVNVWVNLDSLESKVCGTAQYGKQHYIYWNAEVGTPFFYRAFELKMGSLN